MKRSIWFKVGIIVNKNHSMQKRLVSSFYFNFSVEHFFRHFLFFRLFHTFFVSRKKSVSGMTAGRRPPPQSIGSPRPARPRGRTVRPMTSTGRSRRSLNSVCVCPLNSKKNIFFNSILIFIFFAFQFLEVPIFLLIYLTNSIYIFMFSI
jgi:hypothetical protein